MAASASSRKSASGSASCWLSWSAVRATMAVASRWVWTFFSSAWACCSSSFSCLACSGVRLGTAAACSRSRSRRCARLLNRHLLGGLLVEHALLGAGCDEQNRRDNQRGGQCTQLDPGRAPAKFSPRGERMVSREMASERCSVAIDWLESR